MSLIDDYLATIVRDPDLPCPSKGELTVFLEECFAYKPCLVELNKLHTELKEKWNITSTT